MTTMFIKKKNLGTDGTDLCSIITYLTIPHKRITVYFGTMYNKSVQHITKGLYEKAASYHHTHTYSSSQISHIRKPPAVSSLTQLHTILLLKKIRAEKQKGQEVFLTGVQPRLN